MKTKNTFQKNGLSTGNFKISFSDYRIMKHISQTCKGYKNLLADIKK